MPDHLLYTAHQTTSPALSTTAAKFSEFVSTAIQIHFNMHTLPLDEKPMPLYTVLWLPTVHRGSYLWRGCCQRCLRQRPAHRDSGGEGRLPPCLCGSEGGKRNKMSLRLCLLLHVTVWLPRPRTKRSAMTTPLSSDKIGRASCRERV